VVLSLKPGLEALLVSSYPTHFGHVIDRFKIFIWIGHAIVIGRPTDRVWASRDQCFRRQSSAKRKQGDPRSRPARRDFESEPGSIPVGAIWHRGVPAAGEPAILFLPAHTVRQLVGISVGIGNDQR
jgi:hypothetical protein